MFEQLPKAIQKQVLSCLETDNFVLAKKLYDAWLEEAANCTIPPASPEPAEER